MTPILMVGTCWEIKDAQVYTCLIPLSGICRGTFMVSDLCVLLAVFKTFFLKKLPRKVTQMDMGKMSTHTTFGSSALIVIKKQVLLICLQTAAVSLIWFNQKNKSIGI